MTAPFRFLHLADLHLDTAFRGRSEEVREALRRATREAFEAAVTTAIEREAHAVLLAGDVFDSDVLTFATEAFLLDGCRRLEAAGIAVVYCTGNHDPGGASHRVRALDWPANVHLVHSATPTTITVHDGGGEPVGRVVSAGFAKREQYTNLAAKFPAMDGGLPTVGLVHTQVEGAAAGEAHTPYAPSSRADFEKPGYHYWALGHIHRRQQVFPDLPVHYPGNLQGRHPREPGPKGGNWVTIPPMGLANVAFVPLAPLEWQSIEIQDPAGDSLDALVAELAEQVPASEADRRLVRLALTGASPLAEELARADNRAELEAQLAARLGALDVELRVGDLHRPVDVTELRATPSPLATALELREQALTDDDLLDRLTPAALSPSAPSEPAERRAYLRELLTDLEPTLIERLVARGGGE
jgi:DNA repair exonuclease SbcCD nuclease subunit